MMIFGLLSFLAITLFGVAVIIRTVRSATQCRAGASRRIVAKITPAQIEQRRADFWFGIASRLVWGSILVCFSLLGALATLDVVAG